MFSANSFSPASFSIQSFKMAQQDQARSGYWRLFYTEMQEKSLEEDRRKREQEQRKEAPQGTVEVTPAKPIAKPKPKPKPRVKPVPRDEHLDEPVPHVVRPIYVAQPDPFEFVTPLLRIISIEFHSWNLSSKPLVALLEKQAANDEDEEEAIHLLLMAA